MSAVSRNRYLGPLLIADRFDVTLAFYRDALGLPFEGAPPYAECRGEGARFSILDGNFWTRVNGTERPAVLDPGSAAKTVLAIQVPDVDELCQRLEDQEMRLMLPPTDRPAMGLRNAFLLDPDGRVVELTTPRPHSG